MFGEFSNEQELKLISESMWNVRDQVDVNLWHFQITNLNSVNDWKHFELITHITWLESFKSFLSQHVLICSPMFLIRSHCCECVVCAMFRLGNVGSRRNIGLFCRLFYDFIHSTWCMGRRARCWLIHVWRWQISVCAVSSTLEQASMTYTRVVNGENPRFFFATSITVVK